MSVLAVIPARGGSKGIKNKNLVEIAGKSLLEWTVDAVRAAKTVDHLFVSTDSIDILRFVEGVLDVEPLIRPPHLATDHASSEDVVLHALDRTREWGFLADVTVMLQCTSPLTLPEDIDGTVEALLAPAGMTGGVPLVGHGDQEGRGRHPARPDTAPGDASRETRTVHGEWRRVRHEDRSVPG